MRLTVVHFVCRIHGRIEPDDSEADAVVKPPPGFTPLPPKVTGTDTSVVTDRQSVPTAVSVCAPTEVPTIVPPVVAPRMRTTVSYYHSSDSDSEDDDAHIGYLLSRNPRRSRQRGRRRCRGELLALLLLLLLSCLLNFFMNGFAIFKALNFPPSIVAMTFFAVVCS